MIIDAHAHVIPDSFPPGDGPAHPRVAACDDGSGDRMFEIEDTSFRAVPVWSEVERRLEALDAAGLDGEIVSPFPPLLNYRLGIAEATTVAGHLNEWIAELSRSSGGRIHGLGFVPLQDPEAAAGMLAGLRDAGLRGLEVGSHVNGTSIGDARLTDFFREVERLGLSVFVHAIRPAIGDRLPPNATATFGFGTEAALAAASLVTGGTLAACPDVRIAVSHGGGGFPFVLPRAHFFETREWSTPATDAAAIHADGETRSVELARRLYYDGLVFDTRALDYLAQVVGLDRILLGSDFPAIPRQSPGTSPLEQLAGGTAAMERIAGENALAFLGLAAEER